jgi:hypothetical protein
MTVVGETLLGLRVGVAVADTVIAGSKHERNSTSTYFLLNLAFKNGDKKRTQLSKVLANSFRIALRD